MLVNRPRRLVASVAAVAAVLFGVVVTAPSVASASPTPPFYWVNNAVASVPGNGTSCSSPGFATIQAAVTRAETHTHGSILVCPGTYPEQVQVTAPNTSLTIQPADAHTGVELEVPAVPADSTTSCDTALGTGSYQPDQDGFVVCGTSTTHVTVTGLTFNEAWPGGTCDDSLYGILVGGRSSLKMTHSLIVAGGAVPINGCQGGIGIQVGMAWTTPVEIGHATLSNDTISGYQKNGATIDGKGSTAAFWEDTVDGAGATTAIAQNGIQVSNGAFANIDRTTITGNECNVSVCGPNALTQTQSTGVLFYGAAKNTLLTDSTITNNDIGMYFASERPTLSSTAEVSATFDTFTSNRYEGILFDAGRARLANDKVRLGDVGIMLIQYNGQPYGDFDRITTTSAKQQTAAAVEILSDQVPGDKPGAAVFTNCQISGPILSNSSNVTVTLHR